MSLLLKAPERHSSGRNLQGRRFGTWVVLGPAPASRDSRVRWLCECDCGKTRPVFGCHLLGGRSKNCGCKRGLKHGDCREGWGKRSPEYRVWVDAKQRCFNRKNPFYSHYGGRGITVAPEWREDFSAFLRDMGRRPQGASLDRKDNDGPYSPGNCRWATREEQNVNRRDLGRSTNRLVSFNGRTLSVAAWAKSTGINYGTLYSRLRKGWTPKDALTPPETMKRRTA